MHKDDWGIILGVICAVTGVVGTFFTLSIALGFNRHIGRWIANRFGAYEPDYGEEKDSAVVNRHVRRYIGDVHM